MSVGLFTPPTVLENVTHTIFHGVGSSGGHNGAFGRPCKDLNQRLIPHGVHFVPGPDACTLCSCDDGEPKWCKAVLCSPPQDCKSFRVGTSCCDFICMDDSLNNNGPNTGGPYLSRPVEIANFVPKVVIAAVTAMLSLSLLFFLIHRLRQRHIQGRLNSARARRSTTMCDECDDTRSLDFSNDFFEHRMNSPHLYPPQYLAWWKPPSSYFPPRGEAPPPYEEALTTSSLPYNNNNLQNNNNNHSRTTSGGILTDIPIIIPPPVIPPMAVTVTSQAARSPAVARLASAIANATGGNASTTTTTTVVSSGSPKRSGSAKRNSQDTNSQQIQENTSKICDTAAASSSSSALKSSTRSSHGPKKCERKSKTSKSKDRHPSIHHHPQHHQTTEQDPQPGPSRNDSEGAPISSGLQPQYRGAPPPYEDSIYSVQPQPQHPHASREYQRHSLTLPSRRYDGNHLYPVVVVRSDRDGPLTCYTEEEMNVRGGGHHHHNQRYSLQFDVGGGDIGAVGGDWSSSSSTLSLSTTPNSPIGRPPSLSSSSESSVSESNPPPPPHQSNSTSRA